MGCNIKILVCCHKADRWCDKEPYLPIQVGKSISNIDLNIQGDDSGMNISSKNGSYCELTGMYWAWKNLKDVDVIGLCHYRRYFDFHNQCERLKPHTSFPQTFMGDIDFSIPDKIRERVMNGAVVIAKPNSCRYNLKADYCICHNSTDFKTLECVIKETQPHELRKTFFRFFYQNNRLSPYNMYLMNWKDFDSYCAWLFPIIEKLEYSIDVSTYNTEQRRVFGFIAERLLNVWVLWQKKNIITKPVIWFTEGYDQMKYYGKIRYFCRVTLDGIINLLARYSG